MKNTVFIVSTLLIIILFTNCNNQKNSQNETEIDSSSLSGEYLGQKPPGVIPEIFAPGIISSDSTEGCSAFLDNGKLFIYNVFFNNKSSIFEMKLRDGIWSEPKLSTLNSEAHDGDFTVTPDGKTLFFSSMRPVKKGTEICEKSNIWFVKRKNNKWAEPQIIEHSINTERHESYPCVTNNNRLYFFSRNPTGFGKSDIYYSDYVEGKYGNPINLGNIINTAEHEWDPYIDPEEKYLIFCSMKESSLGEDDLYISFRNSDSSWMKPVNMGNKINSPTSENRPCVSSDGKYFFFTSNKSGNRDIYWVSTKVIEELKPGDLK